MIEKIQASWPVIVAVMMALNIMLSAASAALEKVLEIKPSEAGQKADGVLKQALAVLAKILDWVAPRTSQK